MIVSTNDAFQAIGYTLLALFFVMGVVKIYDSFAELRKPKTAFRCFIRLILAQAAVMYEMELMTALFHVTQGMISTVMGSSDLAGPNTTTLPDEMVVIIESVGLIGNIPLWAITLLGPLFTQVLVLVMTLTVYSRPLRLYIATAIVSIPLAGFAGQPSSSTDVASLKSYTAICLEGYVIVLTCVIFSAFTSTLPIIVDSSSAPATIIWGCVSELILNTPVLVGTIKMSGWSIRKLTGL